MHLAIDYSLSTENDNDLTANPIATCVKIISLFYDIVQPCVKPTETHLCQIFIPVPQKAQH